MTNRYAALITFAATLCVGPLAPAQITVTQDAGCLSDGVFNPNGSCVDVFVVDPITGTHRAAAHTTTPLTHAGPLSLNNTDILTFNPATPQFDPAGGIDLSGSIQGNQIDLNIAGKQSIFPGLAPDGTSEANFGVELNETFHLEDTSGNGSINTQWNVDVSGSMTFPTEPPPGGMSLRIDISVLSTVNGNPVQTPIFGAYIARNHGDTDFQVIGNSADSFTFADDFSDPDVVVRTFTASSSIFPNVSLPTGQDFQILGFVLGSANSQASIDTNAALKNDFGETIQLTVTAPDTTTFTQVPEPGSAALLALALPLLSRRRSRPGR